MHSSTIVVLALAAAAAPSLAAPSSYPAFERREPQALHLRPGQPIGPVIPKFPSRLNARDVAAAPASGAISFGDVVKDAGKVAATVAPFFLKREDIELLAREIARDVAAAPASGAFSFGDFVKDAAGVASTVLPFVLRDGVPSASAAPSSVGASGAFSFGDFVKDAAGVASTVLPFVLKREEMELLAREIARDVATAPASGAISFGDVVKDAGKVAATVAPFFLKREELLDNIARSLYELD